MMPFAEALAWLDTIRGVNKRTAEFLLAELGPMKYSLWNRTPDGMG